MDKKVLLMILDGWGIAPDKSVSAIDKARTPFMDMVKEKYSSTTLDASGLAVGLPQGQMGNSEVGHMNLGAGRVVYQNLVKISLAAQDGSLAKDNTLVDAFNYAKKNGKKVHFMGLLSDGGVHSHIDHLKGLLAAAKDNGVKDVFVHAFMDGRDCDPKSGKGFVAELLDSMKENGGELATIIGRYYAMDRDNRWERVKVAYDAMVKGIGNAKATDAVSAVQKSYDGDVTDEFIRPIIMTQPNGAPIATIEAGDVVMCFNFRSDRGREITNVLTQQDHPEQGMQKMPLHYITMTTYDEKFQDVHVVYKSEDLNETLGELVSKAGKKQIRIAETEKYPHVTFFFSGGREKEFDGEKRILCPSPKVATYDLQPEMSAGEIKDKIIPELNAKSADFICLNFANSDMVGHTGIMEAAIKADETVDTCAKAVAETALANGYTVLITADHGNSEMMANPDGSPNTAHTTNPVPLYMLDNEYQPSLHHGKLGDIAPTILELMGIKKSPLMTGESLINH
ncbi:MAG: 2,3-bisphosphoglycerate-independent phosphoglycerate mutase [Flavobacteriales bacterium]|nr:2,3-bisphosphoglycerate-independent phosphoglycerate mutase [Flavobacteriales bacterium]